MDGLNHENKRTGRQSCFTSGWCPATLGEYRDLCTAIGGDDCDAVKFLDTKIAESPHGRDEIVMAADIQMRAILMPRLFTVDGHNQNAKE